MSLTPEWSSRIVRWREELKRHLLSPLRVLSAEVCFTMDHISLDQAKKLTFTPIANGSSWGKKWEYGWFKTTAIIPPEAMGKRIGLVFDAGLESLVFVNGQPASTFSWGQKNITLSRCANGNETFEIFAESYAGHGEITCGDGPVALDRNPVPEPKEPLAQLNNISLVILEEDAYQLYIDVETLWELRQKIDPNLLRVMRIDQGLRDFTCIADLELPYEEKLLSFRKARERLKPLLECVNGSTAPTMYAFGHAHLDIAWLWPLAETERKVARTLSTQLSLIKEYPDYKFLHSQCHLYRYAKDFYPELYTQVKKAVRDGNIIAEGGMWVESDTNMPSGESLIRQFIHGKRFFKEEFDVDSILMWLPDVFGYTANLPQIMNGCGIKYFSTQKIFWTYNGGDTFPHNTFWWEGLDGSRTLVHLHNDYNSPVSPQSVLDRWNERVQKDTITCRLLPFGHGDGGGGPTRDHLEFALRQKNLEGAPLVKLSSPLDYFKYVEENESPEIVYVGELYYQGHRGTYTSQAKTKRGNRKCEIALREAEMWGVATSVLNKTSFPASLLDEHWKNVLLCQFHDILPGSSIARVYQEAEALYNKVQTEVAAITSTALSTLVSKNDTALTIANSLSWNRRALILLPGDFEGARDASNNLVDTQKNGALTFVEVTIPSCGWTTLHKAPPQTPKNTLSITCNKLENELLSIDFNDFGEITRIYDKEAKRDWTTGIANSFKLWKDVPANFDAWDLDSTYLKNPVALPHTAEFSILATGPLVATLKVSRKLNDSTMHQEISLSRGSRRIDFKTSIDWKERHKVLKVNFPTTIHSLEALHEIQMGYVQRPTHASRQYDKDRFEVCNHKWTALTETDRGCALLNDCKYGVNVDQNSINLTLLRSALAPDPTADIGTQEFTYAFYCWNTNFAASTVIQQSYELNMPCILQKGEATSQSLFTVDMPGIIIETIKPAEDTSTDIIVRLYESHKATTRCNLAPSFPVDAAWETNMLEVVKNDIPLQNGKIPLNFKPFEIKTVRLHVK